MKSKFVKIKIKSEFAIFLKYKSTFSITNYVSYFGEFQEKQNRQKIAISDFGEFPPKNRQKNTSFAQDVIEFFPQTRLRL